MLPEIIYNSLAVAGIVLILTKSEVLACKREYVKKRYEAAHVAGQPNFLHKWWHALWTCPMCSGFWMAIFVCLINPINSLGLDVLAVFFLNWILHCAEDWLYSAGKNFAKKDEKGVDKTKT